MSPNTASPCIPPWGGLPPSCLTNWFVNWVLNLHQEEEEGQIGRDWLCSDTGVGCRVGRGTVWGKHVFSLENIILRLDDCILLVKL